MKVKILQKFADLIITRLENSNDDDIFQFYYELGIWFDSLCINYFDIYLD